MSTAQVSYWLPRLWAVGLAVLMLGPALGPGYVLTYDMVWVPDLALRADFLGVGTGLPRAVPSDAVVAVVDEIVPGMLLQKLVLLACLVVGGWGAIHLAPRNSLVGSLIAVSMYQWNPFVAERLLIGHWPVLLAYALLPWVLRDARALRSRERVPAMLWLTVTLGSLSVSAGVMTGVVLVAFGLRSRSTKVYVRMIVLLLAGNAPWLVSGLLHAAAATTDLVGARAFALAPVGSVPAPLAAFGLGGTWNLEVVLPSRTTFRGVVWLLGLAVLVTAGVRAWVTAWGRRDVAAFVICWTVGFGIAVITWGAPSMTSWAMGNIPGAAVMRDGARLLALCAPALVSVAAHGAAALVGHLSGTVARAGLAVVAVLFPVAVLPDAAGGLSGRVSAVSFPDSYEQTRTEVAARLEQGQVGDVLLLPFTSYRQPAWNDGRKVLDPLGRYLPPDFVANDELVVSGVSVPGEDPRAQRVARVLTDRRVDPTVRSRRLASAGIGLVVHSREAGGAVPRLDGEVILDTPPTRVVALPGAREVSAPALWVWLMVSAWGVYVLVLLAGAAALLHRLWRALRGKGRAAGQMRDSREHIPRWYRLHRRDRGRTST